MKLFDMGLVILLIFFGMVAVSAYFSRDVFGPDSEITKDLIRVDEELDEDIEEEISRK